MRNLSIFSALLIALMATGCGDSFSLSEYPRIEVEIDDEVLPNSGGIVFFSQALQLSTSKKIEIVNPGTEPLVISEIAWKSDPDSGGAMKNPHVELEIPTSSGFPIEVTANGLDKLVVNVIYSPPLGAPLTDFSESILVIKSNARDFTNKTDVPEFEIEFSMQEKKAYPYVNPGSYTFNNATLTKPETQEFKIENNPDLGQAAFTVLSVALASPSDEFILSETPNQGTTVLSITDPMYQPATFKVTYKPVDEGNDDNAILIQTDVGPLNVPLSSNLIRGNYSLSYSHEDKFDFTNIHQQESRRVIVYSEGPGPLTVKEPSLSPTEAKSVFSWKAYKPVTNPGDPEEEITSFPRGLKVGQSIEFELTYAPGVDEAASPNGDFTIPIGTPDPAEININIFAGDPKPLLDIAPKTKSVIVTSSLAEPATGSRHVVLYNNGNGGLVLKGVSVTDSFGQEPKIFSLVNPPAADTVIQPAGFLVLEVAWDSGKMPDGKTSMSDSLHLDYVHFSDGQVTENVQLMLQDNGGASLPVASLGSPEDYVGATAGENIVINAAASTPGAYNFTGSNWALYYLTSKPAGSWAQLNAESGPSVEFLPDLPGDYRVELVVYSVSGSEFLFSKAATVDVTVSAAP